jgi:peptide/nickel transport system substrate-binding protein
VNKAKLLAAAAMAALMIVAAGCGGSSGSGGGSGSVKQGGIFSIGTTNYIDTMNIFNYIEAQSTNAFLEVYPELVQLGPDLTSYVPSYATKWTHSQDGKTWTYTLQPGAKWSDGKPLTSADVAWTANTIVKYQNGPTAVMASAVSHVTKVDAPDPNTVVFHYDAAVSNVLSAISGLYVLPEHVWSKYTGNNGKDLKTFLPENHLPIVSGGPFEMTQYQKKGTTVFKPNPGFWGDKPHVDAVALVYYTNSDSMIADLKSSQISAVDQVPYTTVNALKSANNLKLIAYPYGEFTNITWNSNPYKPQNRELLDPRVKKALSMCVDRQQIISVVYQGNAELANQSVLGPFAIDWQSPQDQKLTYDCAQGNAMLDSLGYKKGSDGVRVVPATTGKYAQPAHKMQYQIMVPGSLDFNGDREFQIVSDGFAQAGVKVTEQAGGDATAAYAIETDNTCDYSKKQGYSKFDIALWDWFSYPDPDFQLSVATTGQWCSWSDTGYANPAYDQMYSKQATLVDPAQRKTLVQQMDKLISDQFIYTYLVNEKGISAQTLGWGGFHPELAGYNYHYMTDPYKVG